MSRPGCPATSLSSSPADITTASTPSFLNASSVCEEGLAYTRVITAKHDYVSNVVVCYSACGKPSRAACCDVTIWIHSLCEHIVSGALHQLLHCVTPPSNTSEKFSPPPPTHTLAPLHVSPQFNLPLLRSERLFPSSRTYMGQTAATACMTWHCGTQCGISAPSYLECFAAPLRSPYSQHQWHLHLGAYGTLVTQVVLSDVHLCTRKQTAQQQ